MRLSPGPQGPLRVLVGVGAARAGPAGAGAEEDARAVARWVPAHLGCTIFIFFFFASSRFGMGYQGAPRESRVSLSAFAMDLGRRVWRQRLNKTNSSGKETDKCSNMTAKK